MNDQGLDYTCVFGLKIIFAASIHRINFFNSVVGLLKIHKNNIRGMCYKPLRGNLASLRYLFIVKHQPANIISLYGFGKTRDIVLLRG